MKLWTFKQQKQWVWIYLTRWVLRNSAGHIMRMISQGNAFYSDRTYKKLILLQRDLHALADKIDANFKKGGKL